MEVPLGGSCCANCIYVTGDTGSLCASTEYIAAEYEHKKAGENRFVDGKTGQIVKNPLRFCCNFFDWTRASAQDKAHYEQMHPAHGVGGHYGSRVEIVSKRRGKL